MTKARKVLECIFDLYNIAEKTQLKMLSIEQKYEDAFEGILEEDLLKAVNHYWKWKSSKTAPKVSQILACLPDNWKREEKPVIYKSPVPGELKEDYKKARQWYDKVSNNQFWHTPLQVVLTPDLNYAINKALLDFEIGNKEIIYQYSRQDKTVPKEAILALFYKSVKDPTEEVKKHLVVKKSSGGKFSSVKAVLGSVIKRV